MTSVSGSTTSVVPSGSTSCEARIWVPAWSALDVDLDELGDVGGLGLDLDGGVLGDDQRLAGGVADGWIGTSTVTFSPRRTATKSMCSSTRRIGSTWTCLVSASCSLPSMSSSSRAFAPPCLSAIIVAWPGQGQVDRVVAVAVDDGGDLVLAADPAGGALAELGALLGGDLLGSHQFSPRALVRGPRRRRRTAQTGGTMGRPSRSRHSPLAGCPRRGNLGSLEARARHTRIESWARSARPLNRGGRGVGPPPEAVGLGSVVAALHECRALAGDELRRPRLTDRAADLPFGFATQSLNEMLPIPMCWLPELPELRAR